MSMKEESDEVATKTRLLSLELLQVCSHLYSLDVANPVCFNGPW